MIEKHHVCNPPKDKETKIWRYLDLPKFIDFFINESLYFARADEFEDIFEGSLPKQSIIARTNQLNEYSSNKSGFETKSDFWNNVGLDFKKKFAINCWHMNNYESAAMWKLYLKTNEGVAIQTSIKKFEECLNMLHLPVYISTVEYIDYDNDLIDWGNKMAPFVHKRKSFIHEQEVRAIIRNADYNLKEGGIKLKVDLEKLVENIYVAPNSGLFFNQLIKDLVKKRFNVVNSKMDDKPIY
jgi:hypothetical protein